jgi:hypothetical protein
MSKCLHEFSQSFKDPYTEHGNVSDYTYCNVYEKLYWKGKKLKYKRFFEGGKKVENLFLELSVKCF